MNSNKAKISCKPGFTLIELLVVVLIIGVLAAVAVPQYQKAVIKAQAAEAITNLKAITDAQEVYFLANGEYTNDLAKLDLFLNLKYTQVTDEGGESYQRTRGEGKYFKFYCYSNRTCAADPYTNGFPSFQFHLKNKVQGAPSNWLGKHWCVCNGNRTKEESICKTMGTFDNSMSGKCYYILDD